MPKKKESGWERFARGTAIAFNIIAIVAKVFVFFFFAIIFLSIIGLLAPSEFGRGNVAVIPIVGTISTQSGTSLTSGTESAGIVKLIEKADKNDEIKAILFEIDSPGGTPVGSDEIAQAIKKSTKPTVAVIRETGASGAYWIASAADKIYANRMSLTGSIGVRASRLEFAGLIQDYNITYRRLVAGKYKDAGDRFKEMTPDEQELYQDILDKLHTEFINTVAENRHMDRARVRELATGFVFLGSEAKELGLVDELGGKDDAITYIEGQLNITAEPVTYKQPGGIFEGLSSMSSEGFYNIGRGIGSTLSTDTTFSFT